MKEINGNVICSYAYKKGFILQQKDKVYFIDEKLDYRSFLFKLNRYGAETIISKFGRLGRRLIRSDIKAGVVFEDSLFFSDLGNCYKYDFSNNKLLIQHKHCKGMRTPLNYCVIENIDGFDDQICYGEYYSNEDRQSVSIWNKKKGAINWKTAMTFDAGQIRHIHNIYVDKWRNCVYILTGDADEESAIWVAKDNFSRVERMISGNQQARACQMMVHEKGFLYCTDSEYEQNILYDVLIGDTIGYKREALSSFDGSVIYGSSTDNDFFWATTVEPDKGGVKTKKVKVYHTTKCGKTHEIVSAIKDFLPMKLFQYGYAKIIPSLNKVAVSFCGVKKCDGKTIVLDKTEIAGKESIVRQ